MRIRSVHAVFLLLVVSASSCERATPPDQDERLTKSSTQYATARTGQERRDIFMAAIDLGVVARGGSVQIVERLCGPDFRQGIGRTAEGLDYGIVNFEKRVSGGDPTRAAAITGWYCVIEYRDNVIENYWLSDLHK